MTKSIELKLGEKSYRIERFTIGQCEELSIGIMSPGADDPQENVKRAAERARSIILLALSGHKEITEETYRDLRFDVRERNEAVNLILKHAGLIAAEKTLAQLRAEAAAIAILIKEREAQSKVGESSAEAA